MGEVVKLRSEVEEERSPFSVPDYVQLACMGNRDARIVVRLDGRLVGTVVVWQGDLWSAEDPKGSGPAALGRLMFLESASIRVVSIEEHQIGERSIHASWQHVLLEAARVFDEGGTTSPKSSGVHRRSEAKESSWPRSVLPPPVPKVSDEALAKSSLRPPRTPSVPVESVRRCFDELFDDGVEALLSRRFDDAYAAFAQAARIRPDDHKVEANLARLRDMGYGVAS